MNKIFDEQTNFEELYDLNRIINHNEVTEFRDQYHLDIKPLSDFEEGKNVKTEIIVGYDEFCNMKIAKKIGLKKTTIILNFNNK